MAKYREYFYYEGYVICMYKGEAKWKIPHFEDNGFRKLEDAFRYIDRLNEVEQYNQIDTENIGRK